MSLFICPLCGMPLTQGENAYRCPKNHSYDIGAQGYVNLLLPNKKHSKLPGDNKQMVAARRAFLEQGHYRFLSDAANAILCDFLLTRGTKHPIVLDCGCGEGTYTQSLNVYLHQKGLDAHLLGLDISKAAVQTAAKKQGDNLNPIGYGVCSIAQLPVKPKCADAILSICAPVPNAQFRKVLRKGGGLLLATPCEEHLFGLKEVLYEQPYKNAVKALTLEGFELLSEKTVQQEATFSNAQDILNLFMMTPYYWKTPIGAAEKISSLVSLCTILGFHFQLWRKS